MEPIEPPRGWGDDDLTSFLETAHRNRFATFANKSKHVQKLILADLCFLRIHVGWKDPGSIIAPLLSIRAHAAFRAACDLAFSGQVTDTFAQVRTCLEYAGREVVPVPETGG